MDQHPLAGGQPGDLAQGLERRQCRERDRCGLLERGASRLARDDILGRRDTLGEPPIRFFSRRAKTSSPGRNLVTSGPTLSITPAASQPRATGGWRRSTSLTLPSRILKSSGFRLAALTAFWPATRIKILLAAGDVDLAGDPDSEVGRCKPAVAHRAPRLVVVVVVAAHHRRALDVDLAHRPVARGSLQLVEDLEGESRQRRAAENQLERLCPRAIR
jgi:hypothetical protein